MRRSRFSTYRPPSIRRLVIPMAIAAAVIVPFRFLGSDEADEQPASPPPPSVRASTSPDGLPPPACASRDRFARYRDYEDWQRTLVDTRFRVRMTYEPPDLVSTRRAGFEEDVPVRRFVIEDLEALREAAESAGNPVELTFGYRSYRVQQSLFNYSVEIRGEEEALRFAARPGHSEHQLGTAVDFKTKGSRAPDQNWVAEPAGRWTRENAHRFGFVLSYPPGKESVTCTAYEPWHYRYFGRDLALEIHEIGLTVREYLWLHGRDLRPAA